MSETNKTTYQEIRYGKGGSPFDIDGLFFAFSNEQFSEGMKKIGLTIKDTDKIVSIGAGGYLLKSKVDEYKAKINSKEKQLEEFLKDDKNLLNAFIYELDNHEYGYTWDLEPAVEALGYSVNDIEKDERLARILFEATKIVKARD